MENHFSPAIMTFANNMDGMYVIVNLRGGGEYGEDWHDMGIKEHK